MREENGITKFFVINDIQIINPGQTTERQTKAEGAKARGRGIGAGTANGIERSKSNDREGRRKERKGEQDAAKRDDTEMIT